MNWRHDLTTSVCVFTGGRHDYVSNMTWRHDLTFTSAYTDVAFTNYVCGFYGVLDYVMYDPRRLACVATVPLPVRAEVTELGALPNAQFPSDHLALVCDMEILQQDTYAE